MSEDPQSKRSVLKSSVGGGVTGGMLAGMVAGGSPNKDALVRAGVALGGATGAADAILDDRKLQKAHKHLKQKIEEIKKERAMALEQNKSASIRGRGDYATFSDGMEEKNVDSTNGVLEALFVNKNHYASLAEKQLGKLFENTGIGRNRNLGPSAREASSRLAIGLKTRG